MCQHASRVLLTPAIAAIFGVSTPQASTNNIGFDQAIGGGDLAPISNPAPIVVPGLQTNVFLNSSSNANDFLPTTNPVMPEKVVGSCCNVLSDSLHPRRQISDDDWFGIFISFKINFSVDANVIMTRS